MAEEKEFKKSKKVQVSEDMTPEQARAYRASLYKPAKLELSEEDKKEQFRVFWAQAKQQYGKAKDLEDILWLHLKATKNDNPEKYEQGIKHFGLKKI